MRCKYNDRDLSQRLDHTICRYRGLPYYVRHDGDDLLLLYDLEQTRGNPVHRIHSSDTDFDISTVPLGYFQVTPDTVIRVTRLPHRRFKQAIDADSIRYEFLPKTNHTERFSMFCAGFKDMIIDNYPNPLKVLERFKNTRFISGTGPEVAISRDIALQYSVDMGHTNVYFKNENPACGWIPKNSKTIVVPNSEKAWIISMYLTPFGLEIE